MKIESKINKLIGQIKLTSYYFNEQCNLVAKNSEATEQDIFMAHALRYPIIVNNNITLKMIKNYNLNIELNLSKNYYMNNYSEAINRLEAMAMAEQLTKELPTNQGKEKKREKL